MTLSRHCFTIFIPKNLEIQSHLCLILSSFSVWLRKMSEKENTFFVVKGYLFVVVDKWTKRRNLLHGNFLKKVFTSIFEFLI